MWECGGVVEEDEAEEGQLEVGEGEMSGDICREEEYYHSHSSNTHTIAFVHVR